MSCIVSSRSHRIAIFSSIEDLASALCQSAPHLFFEEIRPDAMFEQRNAGGKRTVSSFELYPEELQAAIIERLAHVEILVTEPATLAAILKNNPSALPNLKWCQSTFAGVDAVFDSGIDMKSSPPFILTRFAGQFGPLIAEWCLGRIIEHERSFQITALAQRRKSWVGDDPRVRTYRNLSDLTLVILGGCGDIGSNIAKAAKCGFGMRTIAYTKIVRPCAVDDGFLDECTNDLAHALREADYLISCLPSTPETKGLLSADMLSVCGKARGGKRPVFLNVGRGDVIGEESLISALENEFISAAILDVFCKEPLPQDSLLWEHNEIIISPHISGITMGRDVPHLFLENYDRFVAGKSMRYAVDWDRGY